LASTLSPTSVIDLGCGTGAVGRALHTAHLRLRVTGIDVAQIPKSREPALDLLPNVAMESLPFPDRTFGAAVSQFGYEYGEPQESAKEIARVLMPGAPFSFLIHHPDGPIVGALRRQRRAIEGLCGLRVQAAFFSGNETALAERMAILKLECSDDSLIEQAERGLHMQIHQDELGRLQVWRAVVEALAPELCMLDSLPLCCHEERSIDDLIHPLTRSFEVKPAQVLQSGAGEPIALIIEGVRLGR
jgi:SAM-dependent methyltransferase